MGLIRVGASEEDGEGVGCIEMGGNTLMVEGDELVGTDAGGSVCSR
jgi:hypothetical protein